MPDERLIDEVDQTAGLIATLTLRGLTVAVAESLTGGQLTAELTRPAGASAVVNGGVVVYATELKHSVVGVDETLIGEHGPVHPDVARQLAERVRAVLAVDGKAADIGISTTGVAGPDPQGGQPVGTVFVGVAVGPDTWVEALQLAGDRAGIRARTVTAAVAALAARLAE
ncbi:CinA family protein [Gryllotalpicola protaetiae]|uniref:Nicotinamide-nucleotide amidohydrolase family protein n=1 Tax=Gryllotalpicola protaetiae TaxID=2419771 RepID=A0A387BUD5_9MICO|nr:nicotinamide-nucleotide amidohydrolase family protein [Gryllotalpicola protaetiae]AYG04537.1 nicotinamide-nucleotide amidohydrolase family protein [Gryllotalpicola protaetiae]